MCVSKNLAIYVREKGINISAMSRATNIERGKLHMSLSDTVDDAKRRPLKDDELVKVCLFLGVNPMDFADGLLNEEVDG